MFSDLSHLACATVQHYAENCGAMPVHIVSIVHMWDSPDDAIKLNDNRDTYFSLVTQLTDVMSNMARLDCLTVSCCCNVALLPILIKNFCRRGHRPLKQSTYSAHIFYTLQAEPYTVTITSGHRNVLHSWRPGTEPPHVTVSTAGCATFPVLLSAGPAHVHAQNWPVTVIKQAAYAKFDTKFKRVISVNTWRHMLSEC